MKKTINALGYDSIIRDALDSDQRLQSAQRVLGTCPLGQYAEPAALFEKKGWKATKISDFVGYWIAQAQSNAHDCEPMMLDSTAAR